MTRTSRLAIVTPLLLVVATTDASSAAADERTVGPFRFATTEQAAEALTRRDVFVNSLSRFDRRSRLRATEDVSTEQFLGFVRAQALPWSDDEVGFLSEILREVLKDVAAAGAPLPNSILLVKTTGQEESGAAYCRGACIVLPRNLVTDRRDFMRRLIIHELFHVISNQNPELRGRLYAIIGFRQCDRPVELPASLRDRKITNPDGPALDSIIRLKTPEGTEWATPVLLAEREYDARKSPSLFDYMQFRLMSIRRDGDRWTAVTDESGEPKLLDPLETPSYLEQIGRNTRYIIHPDEILAENFVHLVQRTQNLETPHFVDRMREVFAARNTLAE